MFAQILSFIRSLFVRKNFDVYTDGSHKGAWGSWAFVIVKKNKIIHESCGRQRLAGSNRMEFEAALKALSYLPRQSNARIFTDSRILINAMNRTKQPLAHNDQILDLQTLTLNKKITWHWVKAHSGVKYNERCDQLCIEARQQLPHN